MSFASIKSLGDIEKSIPKGGGQKFLNLKDGDSYRIRFRQELTEDSTNYDSERGTAIVVPVVTSPINFKWKAVSTANMAEYGNRCWATEQVASDGRWKAKPHLLVNVAVEADGKWEPRVLDTTFNQRHIGQTLLEFAKEYGTLMNQDFKFSRTGSGASDTNYNIIPLGPKEATFDDAEMPLHDMDNIYKLLDYDRQREYLTTGETDGESW